VGTSFVGFRDAVPTTGLGSNLGKKREKVAELLPKALGYLRAMKIYCKQVAPGIAGGPETRWLDFVVIQPRSNFLHRVAQVAGSRNPHPDRI
jgi:hypothetical protein